MANDFDAKLADIKDDVSRLTNVVASATAAMRPNWCASCGFGSAQNR